MKVNRKSID